MTAINTDKKESLTNLASLFLFACFILLIASPSETASSVVRGCDICLHAIIPATFPFMVLSSVMISGGIPEKLARIPHVGVYLIPIIFGALSGFPVGARCVRELYADGKLTKADGEALLPLASSAGLSFAVGGIGSGLLGSPVLGLILWLFQLFAGIIAAFSTGLGKGACVGYSATSAKRISFSEAVTTSVASTLGVCGFVIFFGVMCDALVRLCSILALPAIISASGAAWLEVASCAKLSSTLGNIGFIITAFGLGWSGLSVHLQISAIMSGSGIGLRKYYLHKLLRALLSALFAVISVLLRRFF